MIFLTVAHQSLLVLFMIFFVDVSCRNNTIFKPKVVE